MSKKYTNTTTGFTLISGTLKELGEDRKTGIIEAEVWDKSEKKRVLEDIKISAEAPIEENIGDVVTAYGYNFKGTIMIDVISKDAMYHEIEPTVENKRGVAVLAGNVLFAVKNDEIDKTTGQPRLNSAGQPKKPHFDISLSVGQGDRVLHTVKIYDFKERTDKDGTVIPAQKNIERYEKLFKNFMEDKANHPIYVSIRTQPGQLYTVDTPAVYSKGPKKGQPILSKETGEQIIWHNKRMSHLGANAIDVTFLQVVPEKEKQSEEKVATSAPAPAIQEEPLKETSGFDAGNFSMDGFEEFPEMEDFTID